MEPEQYDEVLNAMEIAMRELTPGTLAYERLRDAKDMILAHVPPGEEYIAVEGDSEAAWVPHPECRCHNCIMPGPHIRVATSTSVRADHTHLRYRNIRPEDDLFWLCADSRYRPEPPRHLLEDPDFLWCLDGCNGYASD